MSFLKEYWRQFHLCGRINSFPLYI